ncbi:hypothetical protein D7231_31990 [Streptomyces klenkii]|uniref:Uncharacterized protein n=1 Tax=Streptomyces klenkii TaxID=1420899 RepID=A0A3B0ANP4_9ACTN|nr:hypothetical protein [Streptomyces klenkii]RKN61894.1 hypothetical protein D7231_31990 [Streptomyces klenkii]
MTRGTDYPTQGPGAPLCASESAEPPVPGTGERPGGLNGPQTGAQRFVATSEATHYGVATAAAGDGDRILALGHTRRAIAACLAHARWCGYEAPVDGTVRQEWVVLRDPDPALGEDTDADWCFDWSTGPGAVPVTLLDVPQ